MKCEFLNEMKTRSSSAISGIIIIAVLILKNPFTACTNYNTPFYDKVLDDFDTHSYFVAVDIKSSSYKGRVIIENNNLYQFFQRTKGLNREKYKYQMKRILAHHKVLTIENKDYSESNFLKVSELESVIQVANRGSEYFIAYYFNGVVLNYGITDEERDAIINQLFYWNVPAKIDNLTGDLIIG
jgi:hypothetical protein